MQPGKVQHQQSVTGAFPELAALEHEPPPAAVFGRDDTDEDRAGWEADADQQVGDGVGQHDGQDVPVPHESEPDVPSVHESRHGLLNAVAWKHEPDITISAKGGAAVRKLVDHYTTRFMHDAANARMLARAVKNMAGGREDALQFDAAGPAECNYQPATDTIHMSPMSDFGPQSGLYVLTAAHELGHMTGHESRTGRIPKEGLGDRLSPARAYEELVAERLGAKVAEHYGMGIDIERNREYIEAWQPYLASPEKMQEVDRDVDRAFDLIQKSAEYKSEQEKQAELKALGNDYDAVVRGTRSVFGLSDRAGLTIEKVAAAADIAGINVTIRDVPPRQPFQRQQTSWDAATKTVSLDAPSLQPDPKMFGSQVARYAAYSVAAKFAAAGLGEDHADYRMAIRAAVQEIETSLGGRENGVNLIPRKERSDLAQAREDWSAQTKAAVETIAKAAGEAFGPDKLQEAIAKAEGVSQTKGTEKITPDNASAVYAAGIVARLLEGMEKADIERATSELIAERAERVHDAHFFIGRAEFAAAAQAAGVRSEAEHVANLVAEVVGEHLAAYRAHEIGLEWSAETILSDVMAKSQERGIDIPRNGAIDYLQAGGIQDALEHIARSQNLIEAGQARTVAGKVQSDPSTLRKETQVSLIDGRSLRGHLQSKDGTPHLCGSKGEILGRLSNHRSAFEVAHKARNGEIKYERAVQLARPIEHATIAATESQIIASGSQAKIELASGTTIEGRFTLDGKGTARVYTQAEPRRGKRQNPKETLAGHLRDGEFVPSKNGRIDFNGVGQKLARPVEVSARNARLPGQHQIDEKYVSTRGNGISVGLSNGQMINGTHAAVKVAGANATEIWQNKELRGLVVGNTFYAASADGKGIRYAEQEAGGRNTVKGAAYAGMGRDLSNGRNMDPATAIIAAAGTVAIYAGIEAARATANLVGKVVTGSSKAIFSQAESRSHTNVQQRLAEHYQARGFGREQAIVQAWRQMSAIEAHHGRAGAINMINDHLQQMEQLQKYEQRMQSIRDGEWPRSAKSIQAEQQQRKALADRENAITGAIKEAISNSPEANPKSITFDVVEKLGAMGISTNAVDIFRSVKEDIQAEQQRKALADRDNAIAGVIKEVVTSSPALDAKAVSNAVVAKLGGMGIRTEAADIIASVKDGIRAESEQEQSKAGALVDRREAIAAAIQEVITNSPEADARAMTNTALEKLGDMGIRTNAADLREAINNDIQARKEREQSQQTKPSDPQQETAVALADTDKAEQPNTGKESDMQPDNVESRQESGREDQTPEREEHQHATADHEQRAPEPVADEKQADPQQDAQELPTQEMADRQSSDPAEPGRDAQSQEQGPEPAVHNADGDRQVDADPQIAEGPDHGVSAGENDRAAEHQPAQESQEQEAADREAMVPDHARDGLAQDRPELADEGRTAAGQEIDRDKAEIPGKSQADEITHENEARVESETAGRGIAGQVANDVNEYCTGDRDNALDVIVNGAADAVARAGVEVAANALDAVADMLSRVAEAAAAIGERVGDARQQEALREDAKTQRYQATMQIENARNYLEERSTHTKALGGIER